MVVVLVMLLKLVSILRKTAASSLNKVGIVMS